MDADERIEFYRHPLGEEEKQHLMGALDSPILTTGDAVSDAEHALAEYLDIEHVVCLDSYVGALHLTLKALGIRAGDEVIVPAMTFIATPNAVVMAGATPIFADVEPRTGCLTPDTIAPRITQRTKAIIPVHLYGLLCDMEALREFADDRSLILIEDSTDCFEARREGIRPGSHGRAACFSFYATRAITCGEGGAIATHDGDLARRVRKLSRFGIDTLPAERAGKPYRHWDMDEFGWKYNLDNIRGALLVPQIRKLYGHCQRRRDIAATYDLTGSPASATQYINWMSGVLDGIHDHISTIPYEKRTKVIYLYPRKNGALGSGGNNCPTIRALQYLGANTMTDNTRDTKGAVMDTASYFEIDPEVVIVKNPEAICHGRLRHPPWATLSPIPLRPGPWSKKSPNGPVSPDCKP